MNSIKSNFFLKRCCQLGFGLLITALTSLLLAEEAPEKLHEILPELEAWSTDQALIDAVRQQNSQGLTLVTIQERDAVWRATSDVDEFMETLMTSSVAKHMLTLEQSKPYFVEFFLMDNLGANVAMTNKTSDYWQGDEEKFTESFKGGLGSTYMSDVKFDESSQAYLVQVSIPIFDGDKAIGAMTIGVNLDEL
ncbi:hypothetical protein [Thalassolituus sp.]|uniref:PDC sensor domain-containing protein n=1 Tax=Thalassolituus sp. TaxID=2030822 RepID=UPI002A7EA9EC|nr:hypothetical protein [Thalassolituus sp.]|tara:strand:- start:2003 stop:2581 length:579 start_codon:yes stop_codon:yes gene_type:complete